MMGLKVALNQDNSKNACVIANTLDGLRSKFIEKLKLEEKDYAVHFFCLYFLNLMFLSSFL